MLCAKKISKKFVSRGNVVPVLKEVSMDIAEGEFVSIVGRSGSGKTTLLNVLSTLVQADGGELYYQDKKAMQKAWQCLDRVALADKADRLPGNLSGGEQQRVAIARALVKSSKVLFTDEPTGSLDKATGEQIMGLLSELHEDGFTVVMVTHESAYARLAETVVEIEDGLMA